MSARSAVRGVGAFDPRPVAGILFIALAAIVSFQLFVPPIVGIADNHDYGRIMGRLGLTPQVSTQEDRYFGWLVRRYDLDPQKVYPYGPSSTQTLLVRLAVLGNRLATRRPVVDIRAAGAVNAILYLCGLALIIAAARGLPLAPCLLLLALLLIVGTDVAYISFFNSFYSEPAALIGFVGCIGFGLFAPRRPAIAVPGLLVCSLLLVLAKPQYALLSLPLAVVIIVVGRQTGRALDFGTASAGAVILVGASLVYTATVPVTLKKVYLYDVVFYEILPHSPKPEQDLAELGLDRSLLGYSGTIAYQRNALRNPELDRAFYPHIRLSAIARFYARHPLRLWRLLERSSRSAFRMRPENLGNFEKSTGLPAGSRSRALFLWSGFKARWPAPSLELLILFFAGSAAVAAVVWRVFAPVPSLVALWGAVLVICAEQFFLCGSGEGDFELVRHLYLFYASFDALLIADLVALATLLSGRRTGRSSVDAVT